MRVAVNPSNKIQLAKAIMLGVWVYIFLAFIGPFDIAPLQFGWRLQVMGVYGILLSFSYVLVIPLQKLILRSQQKWSIAYEVLFLLLVLIICWPLSYGYYKSFLILGEYSFTTYSLDMYAPSCILVAPLMFGLRRIPLGFSRSNQEPKADPTILITGKNKLDILQLAPQDLLAVKSAGNYVEVYYLEGISLKKKLIRATLKEINDSVPVLIQIHRTHLINPAQPIVWKDNRTIAISSLAIPVSSAYQEALLKAIKFRH